MIFIIAWKNIWRNKIRSTIVIFAITLGLIGGIFSASVMIGAAEKRIGSAIDKETSHIIITNKKYDENNELKFNITELNKLEKNLAKNKLIQNFSSRIKLNSMASTAYTGAGVAIFGVNPEFETMVTSLHKSICDTCGAYISNDKSNQIVVGKKLAEKLKVKLKSKIILTFQDINGVLTGGAFKVAGIYKSGNSMFDEMNVFVNKKDIARLLAIDSNYCHEIAIRVNDIKTLNACKTELVNLKTDNSIKTWKEIQPEVGMIGDYMDIMLIIFMSIILLALGFGIINTMLMVVLERTREIGMLMSIGMNKMKLFSMIMLETLMLTLTGAFFGILISYSLILYYAEKGIDLTKFAKGLEALGYDTMIYPEISLSFFIELVILVIMTGILASIYPALKALKLKPADAVRAI